MMLAGTQLIDRASLHALPSRHAINKGTTNREAAEEAIDLEEAILAEADQPPEAKGTPQCLSLRHVPKG